MRVPPRGAIGGELGGFQGTLRGLKKILEWGAQYDIPARGPKSLETPLAVTANQICKHIQQVTCVSIALYPGLITTSLQEVQYTQPGEEWRTLGSRARPVIMAGTSTSESLRQERLRLSQSGSVLTPQYCAFQTFSPFGLVSLL